MIYEGKMVNKRSDHEGYFIISAIFLCCLLAGSLSVSVSAVQKSDKSIGSLPEGYPKKIKRMAELISAELVNRGVRKVSIKPFADMQGKFTKESKILTDEFVKHFSGMDAGITVSASGADVIINGTLMPFKGRKKWKVQINAVRSDTNRIVIVYEGILR